MGKDSHKGAFEEYFNMGDKKDRPTKKSPDKAKSDEPTAEERKIGDLGELLRRQTKKNYLNGDNRDKLFQEVFGDKTKLPFMIPATLMYDLLEVLDLDFDAVEDSKLQAGLMVIWAYVKEAKKRDE